MYTLNPVRAVLQLLACCLARLDGAIDQLRSLSAPRFSGPHIPSRL